jgi:hypothetical protein
MSIQSQSKTFIITDPYLDITWVAQYDEFKLFFGVETTDSTSPAITLTNPSNPALPPTNASVRIVPSSGFAGTVNVVCLEVLP